MTRAELHTHLDRLIDKQTESTEGVIMILSNKSGNIPVYMHGSWSDDGMISSMLIIRNQLNEPESVDVLLDGEVIELD